MPTLPKQKQEADLTDQEKADLAFLNASNVSNVIETGFSQSPQKTTEWIAINNNRDETVYIRVPADPNHVHGVLNPKDVEVEARLLNSTVGFKDSTPDVGFSVVNTSVQQSISESATNTFEKCFVAISPTRLHQRKAKEAISQKDSPSVAPAAKNSQAPAQPTTQPPVMAQADPKVSTQAVSTPVVPSPPEKAPPAAKALLTAEAPPLANRTPAAVAAAQPVAPSPKITHKALTTEFPDDNQSQDLAELNGSPALQKAAAKSIQNTNRIQHSWVLAKDVNEKLVYIYAPKEGNQGIGASFKSSIESQVKAFNAACKIQDEQVANAGFFVAEVNLKNRDGSITKKYLPAINPAHLNEGKGLEYINAADQNKDPPDTTAIRSDSKINKGNTAKATQSALQATIQAALALAPPGLRAPAAFLAAPVGLLVENELQPRTNRINSAQTAAQGRTTMAEPTQATTDPKNDPKQPKISPVGGEEEKKESVLSSNMGGIIGAVGGLVLGMMFGGEGGILMALLGAVLMGAVGSAFDGDGGLLSKVAPEGTFKKKEGPARGLGVDPTGKSQDIMLDKEGKVTMKKEEAAYALRGTYDAKEQKFKVEQGFEMKDGKIQDVEHPAKFGTPGFVNVTRGKDADGKDKLFIPAGSDLKSFATTTNEILAKRVIGTILEDRKIDDKEKESLKKALEIFDANKDGKLDTREQEKLTQNQKEILLQALRSEPTSKAVDSGDVVTIENIKAQATPPASKTSAPAAQVPSQ